MMAKIFFELVSMPGSEMMKPSSIPLGTPKTHFSGLSLMPFAQSSAKVGYDLVSLFGLDNDVVHIGLNSSPDEVSETLEHTTLVHSPCILQTKRHCDVA